MTKDATPESEIVVTFEAPFLSLAVEKARRLVRVYRSDRQFSSAEEGAEAYRELNTRVEMLSRRGFGLLVDLRDAPPRNDQAFEQALEPHRRRLFQGFSRIAVVVRTASGRMQVSRHLREDGVEGGVFLTEAEALDYLAG